MSDKYQVTFRENRLSDYPMMKKFFETERCGNRAQALLAMGEAFAMTHAPDCQDPNVLFYIAEAIRGGYRLDRSFDRKDRTCTETSSESVTSEQSKPNMPGTNEDDIGSMVNDMLNNLQFDG